MEECFHVTDWELFLEIGVEDGIIFMTQKALSHLKKQGNTVAVMFLNSSSTFFHSPTSGDASAP